MMTGDQDVMVLTFSNQELASGIWSDELDTIARDSHGYVVVINSEPPKILADYRGTMPRSPDRERFLREVLGTLADHGLQFGAGEVMAEERDVDATYLSVTVRYPHANSDGFIGRRMTTDDIFLAFKVIAETVMTDDQPAALAALGIDRDWRNRMSLALRNNNATGFHGVDAANLAEIAFFGKVEFE